MRNAFAATIVLIAIFSGIFYYVFYTPALVRDAVPRIAEKYFKDVTLNSFSIGGQSFSYPETLKLFKIKAEIEWKNEIYKIEAAELSINNFQMLINEKKEVVLSSSGLTVQRKDFGLTNGALNAILHFKDNTLVGYEGKLRTGDLNLNPYQLTATQANFEGGAGGFMIEELNARAYGGQVKGDVKVGIKPRSNETVSIEFSGLKSQELQALNKTIFSQLTGEFSGTFKMTRVDHQLQLLVILAEMRKGGTLEKALGQKIVSYMTDEANRYGVETLLESQGRIGFDNAVFRILNVSQNLAGVTVTLESKKDKFRIQETINIDIARILQKIAWRN